MLRSVMSKTDDRFLQQAPSFIDQALAALGVGAMVDLPPIDNLPSPVNPVCVRDLLQVSDEEKADLARMFYGRQGVAAFSLAKPSYARKHPLIELASQLSDALPLMYPIAHPGESDRGALTHFGSPDGTLKVFQRSDQKTSLQSEELHLHQDGVGLAGAVVAVGLYCESGPLWGGLTCFQNALRLVVELARIDLSAFASLFLPSALTILRTGGRALQVTGPVLYLNTMGQPQLFLRAEGGEYEMRWLSDPAISRARDFLRYYLRPLAPSSNFVQLSVEGQGCFIRNAVVLHGRTRFVEGDSRKRILARKWFALTAAEALMKQVPGLRILDAYAVLRPDLFGKEVLSGHWRYDEAALANVAQKSE